VTKVVKGEFGGWKEVRPTVRREGDMARRKHRNEMILSSPNGSFGTIGAMVLGGGILELDGGLRLAEERFEIEGGLIVQLNMGERVIERREKFAD
jgi:hypothetical protein